MGADRKLRAVGRGAGSRQMAARAMVVRGLHRAQRGSVHRERGLCPAQRDFDRAAVYRRHIDATRSAFGIDQRTEEIDFQAKPAERIDLAKHKPLLDNVRLWDWHAFHDTLPQLQPYRPLHLLRHRRGSLHHRRRNAPGADFAARARSHAAGRSLDQYRTSFTRTATAS